MTDLGVGIYQIRLAAYPKPRILYVGQSKYLQERLRSHKRLLRSGTHHNPYLQNIVNKHGFAGLSFEIICECLIQELDDLEFRYIEELSPECNILRTKDMHDKRYFKPEPPMLDLELPGLELDYKPQNWHRWVYGDRQRDRI